MFIYLGQGADLHMAQLMPLPLTISCSSKSRLVLSFWCWLTRVVRDKIQEGREMVVCVCVCVCACMCACVRVCMVGELWKNGWLDLQLGWVAPAGREKLFGGVIRQCSVPYRKHVALQCGYSILVVEWLGSSAVDIVQLVAHEAGKSILCMRSGSPQAILWWHWSDRTYYLIVRCICC